MSTVIVKNYKGLVVQRTKSTQNRLNDVILDRLLEANDIELPEEQVEEEVSLMVMELNHRLKYEGLATGRFTVFSQEEMAAQMEAIHAEARKAIKTRLLLSGIISAENLQVTGAELEAEAHAIAQRQQMPYEMVQNFLGEDLGSLRDDLLVRKALDLVLTSAIIT